MTLDELRQKERKAYAAYMFHEAAERGYDFKSELVQRLCGVERTVCQLVLDWLEDARFLSVKAGGAYARLSDGVPSNYSIDSSRRAFRSLLR